MNNYGAGAEKVCRFVSTRLPRKLAMTKFFGCARTKAVIAATASLACKQRREPH